MQKQVYWLTVLFAYTGRGILATYKQVHHADCTRDHIMLRNVTSLLQATELCNKSTHCFAFSFMEHNATSTWKNGVENCDIPTPSVWVKQPDPSTNCAGHSECRVDEYCTESNRCEILDKCHTNMNTTDQGCPPYTPCLAHSQCGDASFCQSCRACRQALRDGMPDIMCVGPCRKLDSYYDNVCRSLFTCDPILSVDLSCPLLTTE
jgi:hypothetical protein